MDGIFGVALRGLGMLGKRSARKKISPTIKSVKPSKNIKKFEKHKQDVAKSTEKFTKGLTEEGKIKVRNKMGYMKKGGRVGMGKAMRGGGCVR